MGWFVLSPLVVVPTNYCSASPRRHRLVQRAARVSAQKDLAFSRFALHLAEFGFINRKEPILVFFFISAHKLDVTQR